MSDPLAPVNRGLGFIVTRIEIRNQPRLRIALELREFLRDCRMAGLILHVLFE